MPVFRLDIPPSTRRYLIGRSGGRCNKCRTAIYLEGTEIHFASIGDNAHILAYSDAGPRSDKAMKPRDRNSAENLLLLCKNCHALVDQIPSDYNTETLRAMREHHYQWVELSLGTETIEPPRYHYLLYINLPRMDMYACSRSICLPHFNLNGAKSIRDLGIDAGRLMATYTRVINDEQLYSHHLTKESDLEDLQLGYYYFFSKMIFRSLKIEKSSCTTEAWSRGESLIYKQLPNCRLQIMIDPRYFTTCTASVTFSASSGQVSVSGIVHINSISPIEREVNGSALFLGA